MINSKQMPILSHQKRVFSYILLIYVNVDYKIFINFILSKYVILRIIKKFREVLNFLITVLLQPLGYSFQWPDLTRNVFLYFFRDFCSRENV